MKITESLIDSYIASKRHSWSDTTMRSERFRLKSLLNQDLSNVTGIYGYLTGYLKPYTVKTTFIRLGDLMVFLGQKNIFLDFIKNNKRLFKHAYTRKAVSLTFDEVIRQIQKIADTDVRQAASILVQSGLRAHELDRIDGDQVTGKGDKIRPYFGPETVPQVSYIRLYRGLKEVGLKPHDLRKLFATKLASAGLKPQDLCRIMGWSSFQTAQFYLQPKSDADLAASIKGALYATV